jgi:7,8-dihydropterin-6-yl-methyl-4-(beta-D-ribofuranosyl)aminobenzene 5'-phosphate synthase
MVEATVLVDNYAQSPRLLAEYGLSVHIRDGQRQVLLDTGQGHALMHNCAALGISLREVDHLVISHGHYDHTAGMTDFFLNARKVPVWAHPGINAGHTKLTEDGPVFVGCNLDFDVVGISPVKGVTQITPHVWAVEIPLENREEEFSNQVAELVVPGHEGWIPDPFADDLSLAVEGDHGLSIILGCSHAGVVNILQEISDRFGTREFYTVLGGMHLRGRSREYTEKIIGELLKRFSVSRWRPCHCTGLDAFVAFSQNVKDAAWAGAGTAVGL